MLGCSHLSDLSHTYGRAVTDKFQPRKLLAFGKIVPVQLRDILFSCYAIISGHPSPHRSEGGSSASTVSAPANRLCFSKIQVHLMRVQYFLRNQLSLAGTCINRGDDFDP